MKDRWYWVPMLKHIIILQSWYLSGMLEVLYQLLFFVQDKLVVATYSGLHLFQYDKEMNFTLLDKLEASFEATPVAHDGKIYVASRNGYLYCLGN
jgi:outer membrane protein assembly factor BamB